MKSPLYKGQSITEYAVIIALVAVVSIAGLIALKGTVQDNFQATNSGTKQSIATAHAAAVASSIANAAASQAILAQASQPLPSASGSSSHASQPVSASTTALLSNTNTQTETAGSMGATNHITASSAVLQNLAAQLAQTPNTDPQIVQLVTQLANAGHQLGTATSTLAVGSMVSSALTFQSTSNQLTSYLQANPTALPKESVNIINNAVNSIVSSSSNSDGGGSSNSYGSMGGIASINNNANTICQNGGNVSQCVTSSSNNIATGTGSNGLNDLNGIGGDSFNNILGGG